jgi:hypothetical protein
MIAPAGYRIEGAADFGQADHQGSVERDEADLQVPQE